MLNVSKIEYGLFSSKAWLFNLIQFDELQPVFSDSYFNLDVCFDVMEAPKQSSKFCLGCQISYLDSKEYSDEQVFKFLLEHCVLTNYLKCPGCGWMIRLSSVKKRFICRQIVSKNKKKKSHCNFTKTVWSQTFFHCSHFRPAVSSIFRLVSAAVCLPPPRRKVLLQEVNSHSRMIDWLLNVREVFIVAVSENSSKLGGKDQVVELAEAKWKTKNFKEALWDWAFGGIDRQSNETFLVPVEYHNIESLKDIIYQKINPGTIIVTNCTKSLTWSEIEELKKSLSVSFVYPHFSTINKVIKHHWREVCRDLKYTPSKRPPHSIDQLGEYLFKSKYPVLEERLHAFFVAAGRLYPPGKHS